MLKIHPMLGKACVLIAPAALLCSLASAADAQTGTVKVKVSHLYGYKQTGTYDPSKNKACTEKFKSLEQVVTTTYDINPKTLKMWAKSTFNSKTYDLSALGLANQYAFGYYQQPSGQPPIYAVLFSLNKSFGNPVSRIILQLDAETNCSLTNEVKAAAMVKSSK